MSFLWPRLPPQAASEVWERIRRLGASELTPHATASHPEAVYAATGGSRVPEDQLIQLRKAVLSAVASFGAPGDALGRRTAEFDAAVLRVLADMPIFRGEACRDEVWSFLALVLMPDVARWRFPESGVERFVGGRTQRNVFQRLWWRAETLRDAENQENPFWLLDELTEDALVGLMERPSLSSRNSFSRSIAVETVRALQSPLDGVPSELVVREALKSIRRRLAVARIELMSQETIDVAIGTLFEETKRGLVARQ